MLRNIHWTAPATMLLLGICGIVATWPAINLAWFALPAPADGIATVPMLNAWTIWWNAESGLGLFRDYWDAPLFFPAQGAFAFSEPQPMTLVVAPVLWVTSSTTVTYGAYVLLTLTLNGYLSQQLLLSLGTTRTSALLGGCAVLLHPLALQHIEAIQLLCLWPSVGILLCLRQFQCRPRRSWAALGLSCFTVAAFATCIHHALFLAILLAPLCWLTMPGQNKLRWFVQIVGAIALAMLFVGPFLWAIQHRLAKHDFQRSDQAVEQLSATTSDWWTITNRRPRDLPMPTEQTASASRPPLSLSPGICRLLLATTALTLAIVGMLNSHKLKQWNSKKNGDLSLDSNWLADHSALVYTVFLASFGGLACLLSFGLNLTVVGQSPWQLLVDWLPPLAKVRSVYRFAYFAQLAVLLLGSLSIDTVIRFSLQLKHDNKRLFGLKRLAWGVAATVLALALVLETPIVKPRVAFVPTESQRPQWTQYVRDSCPTDQGVLCLPFVNGMSEASMETQARWMMFATLHSRPIANGYSGFFPESWASLARRLGNNRLDDQLIDELLASQIHYLVVDTQYAQLALETDSFGLIPPIGGLASAELVHGTASSRFQVYRLSNADFH